MTSQFDTDLNRCHANFEPLSPLTFFRRAYDVFPHRPAYVYEGTKRDWGEVYCRCTKFAHALQKAGISKNDTVAILAPNIPEIFEATFAVPMSGAVLNPINIRLDAETIAYILDHGEAKVLITDTRFAATMKPALEKLGNDKLMVIDILDTQTDEPEGERLGFTDYESFISGGSQDFDWQSPKDEWDAISLNYTSGTTSDPKGVVVHHRGAYLIALGTIAAWPFTGERPGEFPVHMSVVPLFHCNGWGHAWALAANGGMTVLVRSITGANLYKQIKMNRVTHFNGAPTILSMLINADETEKHDFDWRVRVYTAAAPPPPSVLHAINKAGFELTHVYGLTETYGHVVECVVQEKWNDLDSDALAQLNARQGVRYAVTDDVMVADPETMKRVKHDGQQMGEIMIRGNTVMKGYYRNKKATEEAFTGGWFHTGDLAVMHSDNYLQIKDRSKDIIISGGENISSVEVEGILYKHPDVMAAAVVAKPDDKWGETPCAFIEPQPGKNPTDTEIIEFCREHLAGFKCPKTVIFQELPKTSTGKIQKFVLRDQIR